ncbi:MAG: hypothetical protein JOZ33_07310 [Acidobacteriaceae bacterium]|nr:hypothetical protein [Acidobacteriaceae bacterium]
MRDTEDRRKVLVRVREESLRPLLSKYEAFGKAYMSLIEHYTDGELKLILDYMEKMSKVNERLLADAIAVRRGE